MFEVEKERLRRRTTMVTKNDTPDISNFQKISHRLFVVG
jgi:ribosomal protein L30/L7E